jgi:hypothetical protein
MYMWLQKVRNKQKNLLLSSKPVLMVTDENSRMEPDPLVRGTDPRIRIRTNISRIRNTAEYRYRREFLHNPDT